MEILEQTGNKKVVVGDQGPPKYVIDPYPFTEEEQKLLKGSEKLFTPVELETVRKEPDISLRKKVLHEYIKMKVPETKNKEALIDHIVYRVMGYQKLGPLIADPDLEEVMVNGVGMPVFVFHNKYGMCSTNIVFEDKKELFKIINRLCWIHSKELSPIIDMSAIDGSRINITTEPIAIHGPSITVRKQKKKMMTITQLLKAGTLDIDVAALLWLSVDGMRIAPANLVIAGMIGSGKTTLLNALAMLSSPEDRIITIEETPELQFSGRGNWVPMVEQKGYDMETLVRNTLRMRPNRIIVGEIRGSEAMALFNAMNVGHKGMGTLHASSAREAISRLESPPMNVSSRVVSNLDLIVITSIFNIKGVPVRRVTEVAEVGGHEKETILLGEVYQWDPNKDQAVEGKEMTPATYLDKLAGKLKISKRDILDELQKRKSVLIGLVNNEIFEYEDVLSAIEQFYREESDLEKKKGE